MLSGRTISPSSEWMMIWSGQEIDSKSRHSLKAVNQSKIFKVGKLRNNSTFFDFSEKCEYLKKLKKFLNLTFLRLAQIWKNSIRSTWVLKLDKLENTLTLPLWKISATFFEIYYTTRKSEVNSSYFAFSGDSKKWKAKFWALCVFWIQNFAKK